MSDRLCLGCSHAPHWPYGCKSLGILQRARCICDFGPTQSYFPDPHRWEGADDRD